MTLSRSLRFVLGHPLNRSRPAAATGAERTLADPGLLALVMELNGSGARYGFDEDALHQSLLQRGFQACRYHSSERLLSPLHGQRSGQGNTLYVRDPERLAERVRAGRLYRLGTGVQI